MVLASELAEQVPLQPASIDVGQGIAPNLSFTQLPAHDPEIVAEMIRLDPSLQSIDPALIMVGFSQGHHRSTPVGSAVNDTSSPLPPLPALPKKRNQGVFEIVTPGSFNMRATKKPQKGQKGGRVNKSLPATARENTPLIESALQ